MATLLAHLTVRAGCEARFESLTRRLYDASWKAEPDLVRYEYFRAASPRTYYCLLSFPDEAAFLRHQASDHHEAETRELGELLEASTFEWVDPVEGASPLRSTVASGPDPDAGKVERAYHRAMPVVVPDWWRADG